ncbi:hypothetical protein SCLCIDRAFT_1209744 [Scleroderma citrinum Foug A]|uniref:Uncharacterized protein n=1 Tax=Scleroderma citrinum Foug A TaxID=1036808 RepID=A0A0C3A3S1_9AGAM|nr:hypothetical protein SCLCIDRAFT_1209744 [Scleroderma citrinum Foug A]
MTAQIPPQFDSRIYDARATFALCDADNIPPWTRQLSHVRHALGPDWRGCSSREAWSGSVACINLSCPFGFRPAELPIIAIDAP